MDKLESTLWVQIHQPRTIYERGRQHLRHTPHRLLIAYLPNTSLGLTADGYDLVWRKQLRLTLYYGTNLERPTYNNLA